METGRPSICTPELIQQAWDYINGEYEKCDDLFPSILGLSCALRVNRSTLYEWAKKEDGVFSDILQECKDKAEKSLVNGGLKSELNSNITKLVLGKFGYHDKQDTKIDADLRVKDVTRTIIDPEHE